jgi:hypothetical protein
MVNQSIHVTSVSTKWFIQRFAKYVYIRIIHLPVCEATCTMMYHRSLKPSETFFASISQNHLKPLSVLPGMIVCENGYTCIQHYQLAILSKGKSMIKYDSPTCFMDSMMIQQYFHGFDDDSPICFMDSVF